MAEQEVKAQGASLNTMLTYGIGSMTVGIKNNLFNSKEFTKNLANTLNMVWKNFTIE